VLRLVHVLYGLQPKATRAMPQIPPAWQDRAFALVASDPHAVTLDALYAGPAGVDLAEAVARGATGSLAQATDIAGHQEVLERSGRPWALIEPSQSAALATLDPATFLIIAVDDQLMALQRLAVYHRRQLAPTVVGITGSASAASVTEVAAALVGRHFRTLTNRPYTYTEASIPLALLRLTSEHEVALLELGTGGPGKLRFAAQLARPQIGLLCGVGPAQLEPGASQDLALQAAAALLESLPADGTAIMNIDDPALEGLASHTSAQVLRYGLSPRADLWADEIVSHGLHGVAFRLHANDETLKLHLPLFGHTSVHVALAAIACGRTLGLGWEAIVEGLTPPDAELRLLVAPGPHGAQLIDDTYEAGSESTIAALHLLESLGGRSIALLGPVIEPDMAADAMNRLVGLRAAEALHTLICVGEQSRGLAEAALEAGMPPQQVHLLAQPAEATDLVSSLLTSGDYLLVKGDRDLASIVAALQRNPEEAK
jgi:UDP-N-acetylmuramoyl-tripeptide--D-alanyl-D-alanine ligase